MVLFSHLAENDLSNIFIGLSYWKKHCLELKHVETYVNDIIDICESIYRITFHIDVYYEKHKQYGKYVHTYKRNKNTCWYIIYDIDTTTNTIYIQHITSNHITLLE